MDVLPVPAAVLPQGFPEVGEEELVSVPDAKFTKGEFEVSTPHRAPWGPLGEGRGLTVLGDLQSSSYLHHLLPCHHLRAPLLPFHR